MQLHKCILHNSVNLCIKEKHSFDSRPTYISVQMDKLDPCGGDPFTVSLFFIFK